MRDRVASCRWVIPLACLTVVAACSQPNLIKQFEYEEDVTLALDGSATVVVNASVPALMALRGLPLKSDSAARLDRVLLRSLYEAPGVEVIRVSRPWRRRGRRFVQIRVEVADVRALPSSSPFAWSDYRFESRDGAVVFRQTVGPPAGTPVTGVNWTGSELVGFRMRLPSRIAFHNAPSRAIERGNILSWEQPFVDRLKGTPVEMEVRMEDESILLRTLTIFGASAATALALLAAAIYLVWRRGRAGRTTAPDSGGAG